LQGHFSKTGKINLNNTVIRHAKADDYKVIIATIDP